MVTEAKKRAVAKYNQRNYKSVAIRWPIDFVEALNAAAHASGDSLAMYVRKAIEDRMTSDGFKQDEGIEG